MYLVQNIINNCLNKNVTLPVLQASKPSSLKSYLYNLWAGIMGNYFSNGQNSIKDPKVKCNDARTRIQQAREKYLKKLLQEDRMKAQTNTSDELDGPVKGRPLSYLNYCFIVSSNEHLTNCLGQLNKSERIAVFSKIIWISFDKYLKLVDLIYLHEEFVQPKL